MAMNGKPGYSMVDEQMGDPTAGATVNTAVQPSMWSKFGSMLGDNKDILASLAGKYADYEKQMVDNRAQGMINQAAAKWSGFQPSLMNMVKPVETPNPVAMAAEGLATAPKYWYDVGKLYEARKAAKEGDAAKAEEIMNKEKNQKALQAISANYGMR
jgi:hypothetical protein